MQEPSQELLTECVLILAECLKADMKVFFGEDASEEDIAEAARLNKVWQDFQDSNPEVMVYIRTTSPQLP